MYRDGLKQKIMRDTGWTIKQCNEIDNLHLSLKMPVKEAIKGAYLALVRQPGYTVCLSMPRRDLSVTTFSF
jgi:hypothetical protein